MSYENEGWKSWGRVYIHLMVGLLAPALIVLAMLFPLFLANQLFGEIDDQGSTTYLENVISYRLAFSFAIFSYSGFLIFYLLMRKESRITADRVVEEAKKIREESNKESNDKEVNGGELTNAVDTSDLQEEGSKVDGNQKSASSSEGMDDLEKTIEMMNFISGIDMPKLMKFLDEVQKAGERFQLQEESEEEVDEDEDEDEE